MNENIIRMAREAGVYAAHTELTLMAGLERFAALVAAAEREACRQWFIEDSERFAAQVALAEREACAKVCDARYVGDNNREDMEARRCAEAIRARGNT
jgi:hypothetical protein